MKCRHCNEELKYNFLDLSCAPPSNAYLTRQKLKQPEIWYPLRVMVCEYCWLVQTEDYASYNQLFDDEYAYYSGISQSWLDHSKRYVDTIVKRFGINTNSHVIEIAANDGYLLQYVKDKMIPCIGIEPTASTAAEARKKGIDIIQKFFSHSLALEMIGQNIQADLIIANNVLAHVPDINDFVKGISVILKTEGVATFEFPHLLKMIENVQFDTIYHEHFSYLSLSTVDNIFRKNGLTVFDVEELTTHGGSLRVFSQRSDSGLNIISERVAEIFNNEYIKGLKSRDGYISFQQKAETIKNNLIYFLLNAKRNGNTVAAYGAAAKGNTLINFAGIRQDLIMFVADRNTAKQGKFMPGSRIPITDESMIKKQKPDFIIILPWNLKDEVVEQLKYIKEWGGKFVVAIPDLIII